MPIDFHILLFAALAAGVFVAKATGRRLNLPRSPATMFVALPIGLVIAILMAYAAGMLTDYCAKSLNLCTGTSDINIWDILLFPLAFVPVFAVVIVLAIPSTKDASASKTE